MYYIYTYICYFHTIWWPLLALPARGIETRPTAFPCEVAVASAEKPLAHLSAHRIVARPRQIKLTISYRYLIGIFF